MTKRCLLTLSRRELTRALNTSSGHSRHVVVDAGAGRPEVAIVALRAGKRTRPAGPAASVVLQVLTGRIRLDLNGSDTVGFPGDLILAHPEADLRADSDCSVMVIAQPGQASAVAPALSA